MARVKAFDKSPGYTMIKNVVLDNLFRTLTPHTQAVLIQILRETLGYQSRASTKATSIRDMAVKSNTSESSVKRAIDELTDRGLVVYKNRKFFLNYDYLIEVEVEDQLAIEFKVQSDLEVGQSEPQVGQSDLVFQTTKERKEKERKKRKGKTKVEILYDEYREVWNSYAVKWNELHRDKKQALLSEENKSVMALLKTRMRDQLFLDNWKDALADLWQRPTIVTSKWFKAKFIAQQGKIQKWLDGDYDWAEVKELKPQGEVLFDEDGGVYV